MSKIKNILEKNKSLSLSLMVFYYILFSLIDFKKAFEINLIQDKDKNNKNKIPIYKTNLNKENKTYKSPLFNYEEENLLQNSFSTNCPFNRIYFENIDTKETLIEINFLEIKKIYDFLINNNTLNNLNIQKESINIYQDQDFPILNITTNNNNKESFSIYYEIMENYTKEYYIVYNEDNKSFYFKGN
jgi:hypothetical protein